MRLNLIELTINILLAAFGGFVRRLMEMERNPGKKLPFSFYITGSLISLFVGIVVYFLCKNFNVSQFLTAGLTALSGYIGAPALDLLAEIAKRRIQKETSVEASTEENAKASPEANTGTSAKASTETNVGASAEASTETNVGTSAEASTEANAKKSAE